MALGTQNSEIKLKKPAKVKVSAQVSAFLNEIIDPNIQPLNIKENVWKQKPFWNIERGRIGKTRTVPVELIVNGEVVATKIIEADGAIQTIDFEVNIEKSSWLALRILPSSHTNPVFVLVNNQPIRANKKSAEWCLKAVDICWASKQGKMAELDRQPAQKDYENAKVIYQKIVEESK